jgi:Tfp pilus assembly protein PilE
MTRKNNGYTVVELTLMVVVLLVAGILFFIQKNNIQVAAKDNEMKTAINSMYYGLEEVFYPQNGYYPQTISSDNLKSVDPALFTDPNDVKLGSSGSAYTYTATNCNDNKCKSYSLKADLINEADYVKKSKNGQ